MSDAMLTAGAPVRGGAGTAGPETGQVAQSPRIEQTRPMCCSLTMLRSAGRDWAAGRARGWPGSGL